WVLPKQRDRGTDAGSGKSMQGYIESMYGLRAELFEILVPDGSIINSQKLSDLMVAHHMYILGTSYRGHKVIAPMADTTIKTPARLTVMGLRRVVEDEFAEPYGLEILPELNVFADDFAATESGVAEVVIPPGSSMIGRAPIETRLRQTHGLSILAIHRGEETMSHVETEDHVATHIGLVPLQAGDTLVAHVQWDRLTRLKSDKDFVIVTSDYPQEELRPNKVGWALTFFVIAVGMILFSDVRLSLCLLTGALGMVLSRVLSIDEAYQAVSWATVFLLASLIPLGQAVQETGTANWIALQILTLLDGWPIWALQVGLAVLATGFTLVMSNVGATVLLVPLAVSIAVAAGGDPAIFALTVAISTSNSFLIPTHQVNALIMGPAGYKVTDFITSGGIMTILFLIVSMGMMNLVF
ncbi:MAG: SLC13 family permease, partial [Pseudomonadota bacterium]